MKNIFLFLVFITATISCTKDDSLESISIPSTTFITDNSVNIEVELTPHHDLSASSRLRAEYYQEGLEDSIFITKDTDYLFNCYSAQKGPGVIFIAGLKPSTTYHLVVYLDIYNGINSVEKTLETDEIVFTTKDSYIFIDNRDDEVYRTVEIGDKIWFVDNLRYHIPNQSWNVKTNSNLNSVYGQLYTFKGAMEAIPNGWRIPTDEDWKSLELSIGLSEEELNTNSSSRGVSIVGQLMEPSTQNWTSINLSSNATGFTSIPAGLYVPDNAIYGLDSSNVFEGFGEKALFLTSSISEGYNNYIYIRQISKYGIIRNTMHQNYAYSVRCVKDKYK